MNREIEVWADWKELEGTKLMGLLRANVTRGKEVFSFNYETAWLKSNASRQLDPDLQLVEGPQYLNPPMISIQIRAVVDSVSIFRKQITC